MCKGKNKKYKYNQSIINELSKSYGVTVDFVRKALAGDRVSNTAEDIKRDYYKAERAVNEVTRAVLNNVINQ
ncbi:hypothetical protein ACILE9_02880 [Capnocytophaga cynodegmi]|uniref:hypothetical protein n=1 Tax=Capnocytophaga cynodegmi TaxID=28189 RepID=UPI0037D850BD